MEQLIYTNKLDIGLEFILPLIVPIMIFITLYVIYRMNKEKGKKINKYPYIVISIFLVCIFVFNAYYVFYKNSKFHSALDNTTESKLIQGKVKNCRYINGKHFADFKIKDIRFYNAKIDHKVLEDKLDATIKVEYITIFKEPIIIRMWEVKE